MNLRDEILKEHSKRQTVKIGRWVGNDPKRFKQLMELFLHGEYRVTQRSAWIVSYCGDAHPNLLKPWLAEMMKRMQQPSVHVAVKRNVLRFFSQVDIPKDLAGWMISMCFDELNSPASPIAVKVHAMTILANIAEKEREITRELVPMLDRMYPYAGAGIRARIRKTKKQLESKKLIPKRESLL